MKRTAILLLLSVLLLSGCRHGETLPEGVLPPAEMSAFLTDLHLTEGYYEVVEHNPCDSATYDSLFRLHGITRAQFDSSIAYYHTHEQEFVEIYDEVVRRLDSINSIKP